MAYSKEELSRLEALVLDPETDQETFQEAAERLRVLRALNDR